jgi:nucleotide-binding universal stress UspA family protein
MYQNILLPTDGTDNAQQGVTFGLALAKAIGAQVTALVVTEPMVAYPVHPELVDALASIVDEINAAAAAAATRRLQAIRQKATALGIQCDELNLFGRLPAEEILEAAKDRGCDLIVMASHGRRGVARMLLGSQAFEVVTRANVPVLIVRVDDDRREAEPGGQQKPNAITVPSRVLIATDGSELADKGMEQGLELAARIGARVTFVVASGIASGLNLPNIPAVRLLSNIHDVARPTGEAAEALLGRCSAIALSKNVAAETVHARNRVASDAILDVADERRCDLIVMASHGHRGIQRLMLGSEAYNVVGRSKVPVLVVR